MATIRCVMSGGSAKGLLEAVGALNAIYDRKHEVEIGAGTSAGGVVLGGLAAGKSPGQMKDLVMDMDFTKFISLGFLSIWRLVRKGNLSDGEKLLKFFDKVTEGKKFKDAKFDLRITGSDYEHGMPKVFSKLYDGEMPIALAMRITAAFPLGFSAVRYEGRWYKDGGVYMHVPVSAGERAIAPLVVFAMASDPSTEDNEFWDADVGLAREAERTVDLLVDANVHAQIERLKSDAVVAYSDCLGYGTFKFDFTKEEKVKLYDHGYKLMDTALARAGM